MLRAIYVLSFRCVTLGAIAVAVLAGGAAAAQQPDAAQLADMAGVVATDEIGGHMVAYCEDKSPATGDTVRQAWQVWRGRFDVPAVRAEIERAAPGALQRQRNMRDAIMAKMAQEGAPDVTCGNLARSWGGSAQMDMRKRHPRAYDAEGRAAALAPGAAPRAQAGSTSAPAIPATPSPEGEAPRAGTAWLSPAQLTAMAERGRKASSTQDRLKAAGLAGRVVIKGQVVRRRESLFIEHVDGPFRSRVSVSADIGLAAYEGRSVVVSGMFEELPRTVAWLRQARLVNDAAGLQPSPEPIEPGLYRVTVPMEQVRAAPGRGVPASQVQAVLFWVETGMQYDEHAWVLLRDGSLYDRTGTPPADLDAARSRELEPQHWRRWKPAGDGRIEWQRQDDHGKPSGAWQATAGTMAQPWAAGTALDGSYGAKRFYGNLTFGGTYHDSSIRFESNGRFEWSRYSQSGTGAVQSAQGVSVHAARKSDGSGTSTAVGGAAPGIEGPIAAPGVVVAGQGRKDDGAEQRGSYLLEGYTLELRYDSGRVERRLSFPVAWSRPAVFIGDTLYTVPEKK